MCRQPLDQYSFAEIITGFQDGYAILIFGSGGAKDELEKQMQRAGLEGLIVNIQADGEMTDRQISDKVNRFFPNNRRTYYQLLDSIENTSGILRET